MSLRSPTFIANAALANGSSTIHLRAMKSRSPPRGALGHCEFFIAASANVVFFRDDVSPQSGKPLPHSLAFGRRSVCGQPQDNVAHPHRRLVEEVAGVGVVFPQVGLGDLLGGVGVPLLHQRDAGPQLGLGLVRLLEVVVEGFALMAKPRCSAAN